jgi:hypothetical protein
VNWQLAPKFGRLFLKKKWQMQIEGPVFAVTTPFAEVTAESSDGGEYTKFRVDEQGLIRSLQFLTAKVIAARLP